MTAINLTWAGGQHDFLLRIGELRILNDTCRGGPYAAWQRLRAQVPEFDDIYETVRLGLIGGGMDKDEARKLMIKVEAQYGVGDMIPLSSHVLYRAFHREEQEDEDALGEDKATEPTKD